MSEKPRFHRAIARDGTKMVTRTELYIQRYVLSTGRSRDFEI